MSFWPRKVRKACMSSPSLSVRAVRARQIRAEAQLHQIPYEPGGLRPAPRTLSPIGSIYIAAYLRRVSLRAMRERKAPNPCCANLRQTRRLRVHFGPNRPILRPFALSTPEVHRRYTRDFPVYLRCTSGVLRCTRSGSLSGPAGLPKVYPVPASRAGKATVWAR